MPSPNATPTPITPPRVPLVDSRTGLIDRAWYLFFLSLFNAAVEVYDNPNVAPNAVTLIASYDAALQELTQNVDTQQSPVTLLPQIAELQKQIDGLQVQPVVDVGAIYAAITALYSAPVTYTADFSVAATDVWIINNKSGSSCTATLPAASGYSGRVLHFQNYQAQALISASSNVVAIGGGAAGTSILLASAGDQCTLVSNGTNWIMMQYVPNNILLLE
jgi:hypothetical protein